MVKKRPGDNDIWDCACMSCGTGPEGKNCHITTPMKNTNDNKNLHMITNVVVGTRIALLRKSRRDQQVQARRNLPPMPPAGVVPLKEQEK